MKKYLDAVSEKERTKRELEALFSLQKLVSSLEHPNKLLHSIFDILYECDVISEVGVNTTRVQFIRAANDLSVLTLQRML